MSSDPRDTPRPNAPGYGDQGPAGAGRDPVEEEAAKSEDEPEPVDDLGGRS